MKMKSNLKLDRRDHVSFPGVRFEPRKRFDHCLDCRPVRNRGSKAAGGRESADGTSVHSDLRLALLRGIQGFPDTGEPMVAEHGGPWGHCRDRAPSHRNGVQPSFLRQRAHLFLSDAGVRRGAGKGDRCAREAKRPT